MSVGLSGQDEQRLITRPIDLSGGSVNELTPLQVALRRKWPILAFAIIIAAGVYGLCLIITPSYVATATVRVDGPQVHLMGEGANLIGAEQQSVEQVHTEMGALNSPRLALDVVNSLDLAKLEKFQVCPDSDIDWWQTVWLAVRGQPQPPAPACVVSPEHAAKVLLQNYVSFSADKESYLIQISSSASDPNFAAKIANGYAQAYVAWEMERKNQLAQQADDWLTNDLANMQAKMLAADAAVGTYRQTHHLINLQQGVDAGNNGGAVGTITAQRLQQRNLELSTVTAELADKTSTLKQVEAALHNGQIDAIAPALTSPVVQALLARHAELASTLAEAKASFGGSYPAVAAAAAALARNEAQIRVEASKTVTSLSGEVAALTARVASINSSVGQLEGQVAGESQDDVKLQELVRDAQTDRTLYEMLFGRLKQVDAERRLGQTSASVVVEATAPDYPSFPKKRLMVAGAFISSLGIGAGIAFAREMTYRRFRDADQVEFETGLPVVGIFAKRGRAPQDLVISHPLSVEAEAVHAVLTQIMGRLDSTDGPAGLITLVTSSLPGEGKSSFCVALGRSAMRAGLSAFILDCDLRRPAVGRLVSGDRRGKGLVTTAAASPAADPDAQIVELMRHAGVDERSGLRYLSLSDYVTNPHGLLAWPGLPALLTYLRGRYDLVLFDTPPVLAVSDAMKLGGLADRVLLLIDWMGTPRQAVSAAVRALQRANIGVTGAVMTKVDLRRYAKSSRSDGFYVRHYRDYHQAVDNKAV